MRDQPTNFSEANALLALDNGQPDYALAREVLADYSLGELNNLRKQANRLSEICEILADEKREELRAERRKNFRDPRPSWCGLKYVHGGHGLKSSRPCPGLTLEESRVIQS